MARATGDAAAHPEFLAGMPEAPAADSGLADLMFTSPMGCVLRGMNWHSRVFCPAAQRMLGRAGAKIASASTRTCWTSGWAWRG